MYVTRLSADTGEITSYQNLAVCLNRKRVDIIVLRPH